MKYKYTTLGFALWMLTTTRSEAQIISIPANGITIKTSAMLSLDGLSLTASEDFTFNENQVNIATQPLPGTPHASITRTYGLYYPITFTGVIRMKYEPSELNGNIESELQLTFAGADAKFSVPTDLSNVNANTHSLTELVTDKTFQFITATSSGSALPVRLVDFTATAKETTAWLAWSTSEEINSDYFEIQHSVDGKQWNEVGRVKANGESKVAKTYAFEHDQPVNGENLYRLKMVDQDNTFAYSRVRSIAIKKGNALTLHPNPVTDWLTIKTADWASIKKLGITNVSGVNVKELNERELQELGDKRIDLHDFPSGIYMISITGNDGAVQTEKIFKN